MDVLGREEDGVAKSENAINELKASRRHKEGEEYEGRDMSGEEEILGHDAAEDKVIAYRVVQKNHRRGRFEREEVDRGAAEDLKEAIGIDEVLPDSCAPDDDCDPECDGKVGYEENREMQGVGAE